MPGAPTAAIAQLKRFLADADPQRVTTEQAVSLVADFSELERLAAAGKVLFAARAAESTAWVDQGHASPSSWLAEQTQGSLGEAISTLETSKRLGDLPETTDALRAGRLSSAQVKEVARAAERDPSAERELVELAGSGTFKRLKDKAREVMTRAASREDEAARYRAIKDARYVRHFTDHYGAFRLDASLTPDAGARVLSSLQAEADALFEEARLSGLRDRPDAYRADALVSLLTGEARTGPSTPGASSAGDDETDTAVAGQKSRRTDTMVVRIDAGTLTRGHRVGGECCEIAGVGPVPVATLRALLPEAWVKLLVTDGVDVLNVCHVGRTVTAHIDSALEERDRTCVVPGCDVVYGLQKHHWIDDYVVTKTTNLRELARVCRRHHDMITYDGYVLSGGPGAWSFTPSDDRFAFPDTG